MNYKDNYRHEYKYLIDNAQIELVKNKLKNFLHIDEHADNGMYTIRSLYFDDYNNTSYYDNENGTDPREKFRIRIYNHSKERILLECKRKERGKTLKKSCVIDTEMCKTLMKGIIPDDSVNQDPLLRRLCLKMRLYGLRPKIIVEYDRVPYIYKDGNVRITFDTNLSSSNQIDKFLDETIPKRSVMPVGLNLLEVKYDDFLLTSIYNSLQLDSLSQTAYSKYYLCRKYSLGKSMLINER